MIRTDWVIRMCIVLSAWRGVELRLRGELEDTGDPTNDFIASYLEYEEPEYNQKKGFTADDFTDGLVGYQTQPTHARSFGWETSAYGEVPFAALLVDPHNTKWCMGTAVTVKEVVVPCGCVRSMGFRDHHTTDFESTGRAKDKHYYYEYDIGLDADVIANRVEFIPEHLGRGFYPHVKEVIADKCFEVWNAHIQLEGEGGFGYDQSKIHRQLFYPAIVKLSGNLEFDAPCHWPPTEMYYQLESNFTEGSTLLTYYYNPESDEDPPSAVLSSYKFTPYEDSDLSRDNDGRGRIKTDYRLVNLRMHLCDQNSCNASVVYRKMNTMLSLLNKNLQSMLCWCDVPWTADESIYQNLRDDAVPVYYRSVHGGVVGAPIIHNGDWVAWTVETVTRNATKWQPRATFSRGIDDEVIAFLEDTIPELKAAFRPNINDVNRPKFAIHDLKDFVPDADLKNEDLDLESWVQIGNPRFIRPKVDRGRPFSSKASSILSSFSPSFLSVLLLIFIDY